MSNDFGGKKRSELPDNVFGIPQERKYPMPDEKHTRSAIKLFNHVESKYEEQLAKAIIKNMKKYNIDGSVVGPNNRLRKYLPKDMIKEYVEEACKDLTHARKLCNAVRKLARKYNANYFFVTDGASSYSNGNGKYNTAAKEMRDHMDDWERNNGFNPDDDWTNDINNVSNYRLLKESSIPEEIPKDMIKESSVLEGLLKSDKDIYYNKGKFDSGEINLCFITGLSGSGKSTMGRGMSSKDIEHYEMDDIICNYAFSDDNLKEYGGLVESFFKGPGKEYRLKRGDEDHNNAVFDSHENYEKEITQLFVKHAISYCKSHKGIKYVCDGIWIFMFIKPEQLKDCAVYIKGTSSIKSGYRALKRDIDEDKRNGMTSLQIFKHEFKRVKEDILYARENQKELKSFRSYFEKQSTNESYIEEGYFRSTDNLEFNLDKWSKSGNHNLLYITGISGSGKTTLAKEMCKKYKAEYIELDKFTLGIVKGLDRWFENVNNGTYEVNPLLKEYFSQLDHLTTNGSWSKPDMGNEHDKFLTWLIKKVKGNGTLYIVEGAQFFMKLSNMDPDLIKGEPLIVVGTSAFKSWIRRIKRDTANDETISRFIYHLKKDVPMLFKYYFSNEKDLQKYIKNIQSNVNESVSSTVSKDHKQKGYISLSSLKKVHTTESVINKYKKEYPVLRHVRCKDTNEYICDGYMWFKENDLVCYVGSCQYTDDHTKWIVFLEIIPKYRGYGLSNQILDYCVKSMKCKYLSVNKNNELAKKIYDKYGFKVYHEDKTMYYMTIDKSIKESSILPQDTGISTVIFDIGDVLVSANIKDYLIADPKVPNEIVDELLKLWFIDKDEVDDTMDLDTYREIVNKRMGVEFSKYIPKLFRYNVECVTAFDYTIPMIQDLKDKGYKVYYLSNWSAWTYDLLQEAGKFDFLKLMDGGVFSYDVGYMKPNEEIYKILLNKYKINPEEAIFFDDREENIEAANKMGIHGVHFPRHDSSIVYNSLKVLQTSNEMANEVAASRVVLTKEIIQEELAKYSIAIENQHMIAKASIKVIEPVILNNNKYRKQAKDLGLRLRCDLLPVKGTVIDIRVLDGYKNCEDSDSAKQLLDDIKESCVTVANKLSGTFRYYVEEVTTDDKGCLNFHIKKMKVVSYNSDNEVMKEEDMEYPDFPVVLNIDSDITTVDIDKTLKESSIQEYGTTGGTIVGANQPDSVYIVNYMQNNVFSGYKESKQAICKKGMNQMYTTKNGKAIPVDIDKFKKEASDISVFRFKETPILSFDKIIENASVYGDFYMLLTGDYPTNQHEIEYDNRFVQEENFFDKLDDITYCTESTIIGQIEVTDYPYMKILTESMEGRCWNYYRDINGVFAMNELTGLRTPSYEDITDIPNSQIQLIERGTVYFGD